MAEAMENLKLLTVAPGTQWSWDPEVTSVAQSWGRGVINGAAAVLTSGISGLNVKNSLNRLNGQIGHLSGHQMESSELSK